MAWSDYHNRVCVVGLHKAVKSTEQIFSFLKPFGTSSKFVYRTVKRYTDTGDVIDRPRSGRPRTVRSKMIIKAVRSRIRRNPLRKQKVIVRDMNISLRRVSRILRDDLRLRVYKRYTGHLLTNKLRKIQLEKNLIREYGSGRYKQILFTDEKIFITEQSFNKQNDRVYTCSSYEAREKVLKV